MKLPLEFAKRKPVLSRHQQLQKRMMDLVLASFLLCLLWPAILLLIFFASRSTKASGIFVQERAGLFGLPFRILKIRSMRADEKFSSSVTAGNDFRITPFGRFIRKTKLDELPQLVNVLKGEMSFVGPRPELIAVYEKVEIDGLEQVLCLKPGITSIAAIDGRDEEELLKTVADPETYNLRVLVPSKVKKNLEYIECCTLWEDLRIMVRTVFD